MDVGILILWGALALVFRALRDKDPLKGGFMMGLSLKRSSRGKLERLVKRGLRKARRTPIAQVKDGEVVRVSGRLKYLGGPLIAPLSGKPCAYYLVEAEDQTSKIETLREELGQDFLLEDETGKIIVRVESESKFAVLKEPILHTLPPSGQQAPERRAFFEKYGRYLALRSGSCDLWEGLLEEDEAVTAFGHCTLEPDPTAFAGYRDQPMRAILRASGSAPLLISDDPTVTK